MTTNERTRKEGTDTEPQGPPADTIDSRFVTSELDDEHTPHIEPVAKGVHEHDHRRVEYVYAPDGDGLLIQARYYRHDDLKHIYEHTLDIGTETPLDHARRDWDRNPTVTLGEEFEMMLDTRSLADRVRDACDRLCARASRTLTSLRGGA